MTENVSLVKGTHNVRTGFQISRQKYFQITNFNGNPTFTFDGRYTGLQANGNGLADFLLGHPSRAGAALGDSIQNLRTTYVAGYVQDDWRIFPSFTLNYGLRYEFARSPVERDNKSLVFSPEEGRILLAGEGVRPDIVDPDWNNFAPRLGFTWRPPFQHRFLNDLVVRGGAGIYYSTDNFNEEQFKGQGPPFFQARHARGRSDAADAGDERDAAVVRGGAEPEPVLVRSQQPHAVPVAVEPRFPEEPRQGLSRRSGIRRQHRTETAAAAQSEHRASSIRRGRSRSRSGCRSRSTGASCWPTTAGGPATTR